MNTTNQSIEELFYKDELKKILELTIDGKLSLIDALSAPFVIASLTFYARLDEACMLFETYNDRFTVASRVMTRFFLGIAHCRHYKFREARSYLIANARDRRATDAQARFYIMQGVGVYRYTYGHLQKAVYWSSRALQVALSSDFMYGRLLAMDLKAHAVIASGQVRLGLRIMDEVHNIGKQLEQDQTQRWSAVSSLMYRSVFGLLGANACPALQDELASLNDADSFSRCMLLLELARQQLLAGRSDEAKGTLEFAAQKVYEEDNLRFEIFLNLRLAYCLYVRGEYVQALNLVRNSIGRMSQHEDKVIEQRAFGFEAKILSAMGETESADDIDEKLRELNKKSALAIGRKILGRKLGQFDVETVRGQDPLGDVLDLVHMGSSEATSEIIRNGWLSLFYELFSISPTDKLIYLDIESSGSLTTFDRGNVMHQSRPIGPLVRKLLVALAQGEHTKETLVSTIWGYNYHPQKHNNLVYTLVVNTRKILENQGLWIEATENGYAFQAGVLLKQMSSPSLPLTEADVPKDAAEAVPVEKVLALNSRQKSALARMQAGEEIDPEVYRKWFDISEATASRDLRVLVEMGLLRRSGKARATTYSRV